MNEHADKKNEVRLRTAPSPTGFVHIGNLRTAFYTYLIAKKYQGNFIVRIEDTDQGRFVPGALEKVIEALDWVGIKIDEGVMDEKQISTLMVDAKVVKAQKYPGIFNAGEYGPYIQSERLDIYKKYAQELVDKGFAYPCFCTAERLEKLRKQQQANKQAPMYDKCCQKLSKEEAAQRIAQGEKYVIRMKIPTDEIIEFNDLVFGQIKVSSNTVDEQVLIKSDGFPTYHLAVVVDDHLMRITQITRGEDWLPSTPKHVLLYRYFGWQMPELIHVPNVLGENHKKLSKRQGDVSVDDFKNKGYLPEAIINFLALLGWNPKTKQEIFTMEELIQKFDENAIHKAGAIFDYKKLDWLNSHYIKQKSDDELLQLCQPYFDQYLAEKNLEAKRELLIKIVQIEKERIKKLQDITENIDFYFQYPVYEKSLLTWKKNTAQETKAALEKSKEELSQISGVDFTLKNIQEKLLAAAGDQRGDLLWPLRAALSGKDKSPSPFEIAWALGKSETMKRIDVALEKLVV